MEYWSVEKGQVPYNRYSITPLLHRSCETMTLDKFTFLSVIDSV